MKIKLPYGRSHITLELEKLNSKIITSKKVDIIENLRAALINKLQNPAESPPLNKIAEKADEILVVIPDKTRAFPSKLILPEVLQTIKEANPNAKIKILIATGLHKPHTHKEIFEIVGKEIFRNYEVSSHNAEDPSTTVNLNRKTSYGTPVIVNGEVMKSDLVIGLGLIEPHFFAGYSGGRKTILPGVAGKEAIYMNHSYRIITHPNARYGFLSGNPVHEDMVEFMKMTKLDFIVNVTINGEKKVTGIFCGDPIKAHIQGAKFLNSYAKVQVMEKADIAIVTNGGYPLDRNLYQAVKGMATGEQVVKKGGVIVIVAECKEGLGGHEEFHDIFLKAKNPDDVDRIIRKMEPIKDQWEAQILARILKKATVIAVTDMNQSTLEDMLIKPASNIEEALQEARRIVGKNSPNIVVVPEGPYIIPES